MSDMYRDRKALVVTLLTLALYLLLCPKQINEVLWRPSNTTKCPERPIVRFVPNVKGRLGNRISSYTNSIAISWELGLQLYLPRTVKDMMVNMWYETFNSVASIVCFSINYCQTSDFCLRNIQPRRTSPNTNISNQCSGHMFSI